MTAKKIRTIDDVNYLKENKIVEGIDIEYKQKLPEMKNDKSRIEFLRDICAFANTQGGQIIYGIKEAKSKAIPEDVCGVILNKPDNELRNISDIIRDGIELNIAGIRCIPIQISDDKFVVVIDIPLSFLQPHRVKINIDKDHRFYGRTDFQRYELSFHEIRDKFMRGLSIRDKIKHFREERVSEIIGNCGQIELPSKPKLIVHIVPMASFASDIECSIDHFNKLYNDPETYSYFSMMGYPHDGTKKLINLEGFLTHNKNGYVQFYREGIVEAVSTLPANVTPPTIHSSHYEKCILSQKYIDILKILKFPFPYCIYLSLVGVRDYRLSYAARTGMSGSSITSQVSFKKDEILLNEVVYDSDNQRLDSIARPLFDRLSNAWGQERCMNYNEDNTYNYS